MDIPAISIIELRPALTRLLDEVEQRCGPDLSLPEDPLTWRVFEPPR